MTIHPLPQADTTQPGRSTAYDSVWTGTEEIPTQQPDGFEAVMLSHDKIYVVLAVVLIIWFGLLFFLFRTDRKIDRLERSFGANIAEEEG